MIKKLMQRLGRHRIIMDRECNEPLLERYYLFLKDRKTFPFNIFVHKFCKGDPGDLHDHPWPYFTLILKGGYYEWIPGHIDENGKWNCEVRKWRGPGHFRFCSATSYHRIELVDGVTPWTLFMPGPQQREWGFSVNDTWIHNDSYLEEKAKQSV
jgi:hypothetical protein